ncbi:hypothetical protein I553_10514 [Mycobacterium xenopi 4042]|uniref:Uncharacterized protein n=1 Tax=Mycobacterium xenopi 4042 TaxID=1299334 RepID=X8DL05_MYCXE|nr:hypothetical protein I553_10514 [Mycobacterium xenopi 4042]
MYATTQFWSLDGQSATEWTLNWPQPDRKRAAPQTRLTRADVVGDNGSMTRPVSDLVRGRAALNMTGV